MVGRQFWVVLAALLGTIACLATLPSDGFSPNPVLVTGGCGADSGGVLSFVHLRERSPLLSEVNFAKPVTACAAERLGSAQVAIGGDAAGNLAALQCDPESRRVASLAECHVGERAISAVAIASSGGVLVAGTGGYTQLRDLNREGMEVVHSWRLPSRCGINALACQGLTVLAGSSDPAAQVTMYDTRVADGGRLSLSDPALGSSVLSVRFHAKHSHLLLLGGDAGTVCVWDIRSNAKCVAPVHTGGVFAAATLSDAPRSVFTVGGDGWLRQVEVEDGPSVRVHARLEDHLPLCAVTAFMEPDHRSVTVVAGGDSGTVHTITL